MDNKISLPVLWIGIAVVSLLAIISSGAIIAGAWAIVHFLGYEVGYCVIVASIVSKWIYIIIRSVVDVINKGESKDD